MARRNKPNVIHVDDRIVVVDKPSGMYSIPARGESSKNVFDMMEEKYGELYRVHRLDRDTSGVLLFARDAETHRQLSKQFEQREVAKVYHGIARGIPYSESGVIDAPIIVGSRGTSSIGAGGKPAKTRFKVLEGFKGFSYLELQPLTGRQHQIRVHLMHINTPLIVDAQYNQPKSFNIADIKRMHPGKKAQEHHPLLSRTPLHAASLLFNLDKETQFSAPLPKDMRATLNQLRKWRKLG